MVLLFSVMWYDLVSRKDRELKPGLYMSVARNATYLAFLLIGHWSTRRLCPRLRSSLMLPEDLPFYWCSFRWLFDLRNSSLRAVLLRCETTSVCRLDSIIPSPVTGAPIASGEKYVAEKKGQNVQIASG